MKFEVFTIDLTDDEAAMCGRCQQLWDDVPTVRTGVNPLKKPEWTRVMMSLEQMACTPSADRADKLDANRLAGKIYAACEKRKGCTVTEVTEPDPVPVKVKAAKAVTKSLFE